MAKAGIYKSERYCSQNNAPCYLVHRYSASVVFYLKLSRSDLPWLFDCMSYSGDTKTDQPLREHQQE